MATEQSLLSSSAMKSTVNPRLESPSKPEERVTFARVLVKLFLHSLAMFSLPFGTYYYVRKFVEDEYNIDSPRSYVYGAIGAVIVVQFIIASYVYQAFREESIERRMKVKKS